MTQTSTLCPDAALQTPPEPAPRAVRVAEPSSSVINSILAFSRNLEVRPSSLVKHVNYLRS